MKDAVRSEEVKKGRVFNTAGKKKSREESGDKIDEGRVVKKRGEMGFVVRKIGKEEETVTASG